MDASSRPPRSGWHRRRADTSPDRRSSSTAASALLKSTPAPRLGDVVEFDPQARFAASPVARLATAALDGRPHLVPVVFALHDEVLYTAVDGKPKTTQRLRRLANIERNPQGSLLVDHYAEDWTQVWWGLGDGVPTIHHDGHPIHVGHDLLRAKYAQYQSVPLDGPVIAVAVQHW